MPKTITPNIARLTTLAALAAGVATMCGGGSWSDATLKTNITPLRTA
jgi:hypothetical protein